ncbi:glycosyltransferase [Alteromonas flava]|uniref:glycosyltransferase n=1 Tax=Alteromonas flava TaxID=2048003 RepID=UPI0013DA2D7A|nr:glycosyltransferase [Alteromonas flava]
MRIDFNLLAITNLYPTPWDPTRAAFNRQQFERLGQSVNLTIAVLVTFPEWLRHRKQISESDDLLFIPYFHIPRIGARLAPFFQYIALRRYQRKLLSKKPDAIYAAWLYPDVVASAKFAAHNGIPCIAKTHGTDVNYHLQDVNKVRKVLSIRTALAHVFCPSQALVDRLVELGFSSQKVSVNYNGVNRDVFYPLDEPPVKGESTKLIFIGSLIQTKGVFELIEAFSKLIENENCQLSIIGKGPEDATLKAKCQEYGIQSQVEFLGAMPLDSVASELRQADFLVLPSYREGVPNVLLEALASGVPVIATTVGGIPEIVNAETGVLVEPQSTAELLKGLRLALAKNWNKQKLAQHAQNFDWAKNAQTVVDKLTELKPL